MDADAFVIFHLNENGFAEGMKMKAVSPLTDFSYDFQDLDFKKYPESIIQIPLSAIHTNAEIAESLLHKQDEPKHPDNMFCDHCCYSVSEIPIACHAAFCCAPGGIFNCFTNQHRKIENICQDLQPEPVARKSAGGINVPDICFLKKRLADGI